MSVPISPPPLHDYRPEYLPAYLSNGLIGIRAGRVPFLVGSSIVNGFAGADPTTGIEGFARVPYLLAGDIELAGVRASSVPERVRLAEQRYDFSCAELTTELHFEVNGVAATMTVVTACSRRLPSVVRQELRLEVDAPVDVALVAGLDPSGVPGRPLAIEQPPTPAPTGEVDGTVLWSANGDLSVCGLAYATQLDAEDPERSVSPHDEAARIATTYRFRAMPGRTYVFRQFAAAVPRLSHRQPADEAGRLLALALELGWDRLRDDDHARWRELWRGRIEIDADDGRWQQLADAALFYLLTSVHSSSPASTSLFGLAWWGNYAYYGGHVMWDIETFALPPLLLLDPDGARSLLDYRVRNLEAAKQNARLLGWSGAMFPWESCPLHGEEVTIGSRPPLEEHVSLDVALAVARYAFATGDVAFLRDGGLPVLEEVAHWIASRVTETAGRYSIRHTIGLGESAGPVDDNAYVNMAAATALREIAAASRMIDVSPDPLWARIAEGLRLPRSGDRIENHTGWSPDEPVAGTPEAAAGIWPVGYDLGPEVEQTTLRHAIERQAPDYVGSPMLSALLPVYALRAGLPDRVPDLLERGYLDFIDEPFRTTDEFPRTAPDKPRANPMFANLGGFLMTLLYGYTGLQLGPGEPATWGRRDVVLPPGWRGIAIERLWARGQPASLEACAGMERAELLLSARDDTA